MRYTLRQFDLFINAANERMKAMNGSGDAGKGKGTPRL
jgi:hypothetical protein